MFIFKRLNNININVFRYYSKDSGRLSAKDFFVKTKKELKAELN